MEIILIKLKYAIHGDLSHNIYLHKNYSMKPGHFLESSVKDSFNSK